MPLEGRYCRLEPVDPARHGEALFAASMAPGAEARHRYLFETPMAREAFQLWLEGRAALEDPLFFVVIDKATGRVEGRQCLMRIDATHGVIEIGSILWGPAIARSRVATEALYLFARYVFEDLGYRRFEWKCHNANAPSKRAAERFGFSFEGVFRQHMVVKGLNRDTAWFAMIDADWPAIRAGYDAWLDPSNFDAAGEQRETLAAAIDRAILAVEPEPARAGLRRATEDDLAALLALQEAAYAYNRRVIGRTPIPMEWDYREVLAKWETWVLPSRDRAGAFDGAIILQRHKDDLFLESIAIAPEAQGLKLGRALLAVTEARARQLRRHLVRLVTNAKLHRNVDWYLAKGYRIEQIARFEDRDILHFVKDLRETGA